MKAYEDDNQNRVELDLFYRLLMQEQSSVQRTPQPIQVSSEEAQKKKKNQKSFQTKPSNKVTPKFNVNQQQELGEKFNLEEKSSAQIDHGNESKDKLIQGRTQRIKKPMVNRKQRPSDKTKNALTTLMKMYFKHQICLFGYLFLEDKQIKDIYNPLFNSNNIGWKNCYQLFQIESLEKGGIEFFQKRGFMRYLMKSQKLSFQAQKDHRIQADRLCQAFKSRKRAKTN